jgi:hypothetical protein
MLTVGVVGDGPGGAEVVMLLLDALGLPVPMLFVAVTVNV